MRRLIEVRPSKLSWWNLFKQVTPYVVVLHGRDGIDHLLENPDLQGRWILKNPKWIDPYFDRYTAQVVAAKAERELGEMEPTDWARRWNVPVDAL
jgi:hypothetical protein